jgi:hypothetical protein
MKHWYLTSKPYFQSAGVIAAIFLFTFPRLEPDFGAGLDTSYVWALNHLFANNYDKLVELIYPYGPLGFLKMPVPVSSNLLIGLLSFSVLKILFICALLNVFFSIKTVNKAVSVLLTLIISYFADIDMIIIGLCTIQGIQFIKNSNYLFFTGAVVAATIGLFIKSSVGVNAFSIVFVSLIANFYFNKNIIPLFKL